MPFLPKILPDESDVGRKPPLTVSAIVETTTESHVSRTDVRAETEPRITPETYVRVKVTKARITETKIKRGVAVARVRVITGIITRVIVSGIGGIHIRRIGISIIDRRCSWRVNGRRIGVSIR